MRYFGHSELLLICKLKLGPVKSAHSPTNKTSPHAKTRRQNFNNTSALSRLRVLFTDTQCILNAAVRKKRFGNMINIFLIIYRYEGKFEDFRRNLHPHLADDLSISSFRGTKIWYQFKKKTVFEVDF